MSTSESNEPASAEANPSAMGEFLEVIKGTVTAKDFIATLEADPAAARAIARRFLVQLQREVQPTGSNEMKGHSSGAKSARSASVRRKVSPSGPDEALPGGAEHRGKPPRPRGQRNQVGQESRSGRRAQGNRVAVTSVSTPSRSRGSRAGGSRQGKGDGRPTRIVPVQIEPGKAAKGNIANLQDSEEFPMLSGQRTARPILQGPTPSASRSDNVSVGLPLREARGGATNVDSIDKKPVTSTTQDVRVAEDGQSRDPQIQKQPTRPPDSAENMAVEEITNVDVKAPPVLTKLPESIPKTVANSVRSAALSAMFGEMLNRRWCTPILPVLHILAQLLTGHARPSTSEQRNDRIFTSEIDGMEFAVGVFKSLIATPEHVMIIRGMLGVTTAATVAESCGVSSTLLEAPAAEVEDELNDAAPVPTNPAPPPVEQVPTQHELRHEMKLEDGFTHHLKSVAKILQFDRDDAFRQMKEFFGSCPRKDVPALSEAICRQLQKAGRVDERIQQLSERMGHSAQNTGHELFDFVLAVDSHTLNWHLATNLARLIADRESSAFIGQFEQNLKVLRIAAEMLALISFGHIASGRVCGHGTVSSSVDITGCLAKAQEVQQLIVTLPWVLAFVRGVVRITDPRCWDQFQTLVQQLSSIHGHCLRYLETPELGYRGTAACTFIVELIGSMIDVIGFDSLENFGAQDDPPALGGVDAAFGHRISHSTYEECLGYTHAIRRLVVGASGTKQPRPTYPRASRKIVPEQSSQRSESTDKAELARILQEAFLHKCKHSVVVGLVRSNVKSTVGALRRRERLGVSVLDGRKVAVVCQEITRKINSLAETEIKRWADLLEARILELTTAGPLTAAPMTASDHAVQRKQEEVNRQTAAASKEWLLQWMRDWVGRELDAVVHRAFTGELDSEAEADGVVRRISSAASPATPTISDGGEHDVLEMLSVHHRILLVEPLMDDSLKNLVDSMHFLTLRDGKARLRSHNIAEALSISTGLARSATLRMPRLVTQFRDVATYNHTTSLLCRSFVALWRWLMIERRGGDSDTLEALLDIDFSVQILTAGNLAIEFWQKLVIGVMKDGLIRPARTEMTLLGLFQSVAHTDALACQVAQITLEIAACLTDKVVTPETVRSGFASKRRGPIFCRLLLIVRRRLCRVEGTNVADLLERCNAALNSLGRVQLQP